MSNFSWLTLSADRNCLSPVVKLASFYLPTKKIGQALHLYHAV